MIKPENENELDQAKCCDGIAELGYAGWAKEDETQPQLSDEHGFGAGHTR